MRRVASLFLPHLAVERLRRLERPSISRPEPRVPFEPPVDDDPGECSVPRGGGWRPGARWAQDGGRTREQVTIEVTSLPAHRQPPMRELGRRSEAAQHPFRRVPDENTSIVDVSVPVLSARPLALVDIVGRQQTVVAACTHAQTLGVHIGMGELDFPHRTGRGDGARHAGTPDRGDAGWRPSPRDSYWPPHTGGMDPEDVIRLKSHDFR